jgi:ABC-type lipoprotein export system ATPase subunit
MPSNRNSSGAGKSTLLHILGTLDKPDAWEVFFNNTDVTSLSGKKLAQFQRAFDFSPVVFFPGIDKHFFYL